MSTAPLFRAMAEAGYTPDLIPVIPPGATLHPSSRVRPQDRGKVPGTRGDDGAWHGFAQWQQLTTQAVFLDIWGATGANVGLHCRRVRAVDIDILDADLAQQVETLTLQYLGPAPVRIGQEPKRLLVYQVQEDQQSASSWDEHWLKPDGSRVSVQLLGPGKQFVALGQHPSGVPYRWQKGRPPTLDNLIVVNDQTINSYRSQLRQFFETNGFIPRSDAEAGDHEHHEAYPIGHPKLRTDPAAAAAILAKLPNDYDYHSWIKLSHAFVAAVAKDEQYWPIYEDWCEKYNGPIDPAKARKVWDSVTESQVDVTTLVWEAKRRGIDLGEHGAPPAVRPEDVFTPLPDPYEDEPVIYAGDWAGVEPRPREWVIDGWLPAGASTLVAGRAGIGKSRLVQQLATCVAAGRDFFGSAVKQGPVVYFACEDDDAELHRRQDAICRVMQLDMATLGRQLAVMPRLGRESALVARADASRLRGTDLRKWLRSFTERHGTRLLILDPLTSVYGGGESDRGEVYEFIGRYLGEFALSGCAVMLVGHPPKTEGVEWSGSTAWEAAVRSRWYLEKGKGSLRLALNKSNYSAHTEITLTEGEVLLPRWTNAVERRKACRDAVAMAVRRVVNGRPEEHRAKLSMAPTSSRRIDRTLKRLNAPEIAQFSNEEIEAAARELIDLGLMVEMPIGRSADRHPVIGLMIVEPDFS